MKTKDDYIRAYRECYDDCLVVAGDENPDDVTAGAEALFAEFAGPEEIAGYYLTVHAGNAKEVWGKEMECKKLCVPITDTDREVSRILDTIGG